jgi:hypothetical protein
LCGTEICRGYYLSYNRKHVKILEDAKPLLLDKSPSSFLVFNSLLLRRSIENFKPEMETELLDHSIGQNVFKNSPEWMRVWAFYLLQEMLKEKKDLYNYYLNSNKKVRQNILDDDFSFLSPEKKLLKYEIDNLFQNRIQNLMISFDKILNFNDHQLPELRLEKPFIVCSLKESISLVSNWLQKCLKLIEPHNNELSHQITYFLKKGSIKKDSLEGLLFNNNNQELKTLVNGKYLLLLLSTFIKKNSALLHVHPALSDILYFQSFTTFQFRMSEYQGFDFDIQIRDCDLTNPQKFLTKSVQPLEDQLDQAKARLETIRKNISAFYAWGQMVFWNRQTLTKPGEHLRQKLAGTLQYPDIHQSFISKYRPIGAEYPRGSRQIWLNSIKERPGKPWGKDVEWKFNLEKDSVFGTFVFDDFVWKTNHRFAILDNVDSGLLLKRSLFVQIWKQMLK